MAEIISQLNYHHYSIMDQCKQLNALLSELGEQELEIESGVTLTNAGLFGLDTRSQQQIRLQTVDDLLEYIITSRNQTQYMDDAIFQLQILSTFSNNLKNRIAVKQKQFSRKNIGNKNIDVV